MKEEKIIKLIESCKELYCDIDDCIGDLLKSRIEKDKEAEGCALFKMEGLMVGTMQYLSYIISVLKDE